MSNNQRQAKEPPPEVTQKDRQVARMVARQVYELMRHDSEELPPHDRDAEMRVLGAMIVSPSVIPKVKEVLTKDSFYIERYGQLYDEVLKSARDLATPEGFYLLQKTNAYLGLGMMSYTATLEQMTAAANAEFARIMVSTPVAAHVMTDAQIVADMHFRRRLIRALGILTGKARDTTVSAYTLKNMAKGLLEKVTGE